MRDDLTHELSRRGKTALRLGLLVLLGSTLAYYALGCVIGMNARHGKSLTDLGDDRWEISECLYAAAITVTTVGYGDVLGTDRCHVFVDDSGRRRWENATDTHEEPGFDASTAALETDWSPLTRLVTTLQVIVGMGFFLYVIAQVTSFFSEGGHDALLNERLNMRLLGRLEDHVVLCGATDVARQALRWLHEQGVPCAVIDLDVAVLREIREEFPAVPTVVGDATD